MAPIDSTPFTPNLKLKNDIKKYKRLVKKYL